MNKEYIEMVLLIAGAICIKLLLDRQRVKIFKRALFGLHVISGLLIGGVTYLIFQPIVNEEYAWIVLATLLSTYIVNKVTSQSFADKSFNSLEDKL